MLHRRGLRGRTGRHRDQRPRPLLKVGGPGPGRHSRTAPGGGERAARRAFHRPAHQDRAVRPVAGRLRPPRRIPLVVLAATSPADCFDTHSEAARIAVKYMTPVIVLTNAYLSNGSEPFRIPKLSELPKFEVPPLPKLEDYKRFMRDPETLARPWAYPGLAGYEHTAPAAWRRQNVEGNISYDAVNHEVMTKLRAEKIARVVGRSPATKINGPEEGENCWW